MILSIIIISHNQKEQLRRCLESILAQDLPFEHEIIVSDDRSTDGTRELIREYEGQYPGLIKGYWCNSDECNPANNSHRSGWNRCNAYPHATGKYIAHVDADDYFRPGADVYKRQVEMLEAHSECSLCMSNVVWKYKNKSIEECDTWFPQHSFRDGQIITDTEFIREKMFIINQAFIQRRNPNVNPVSLYGKRYVDSIITFHHLQFGSIACVDACDYLYVQDTSSVTGEIFKTNDNSVLWCLGIYVPALIPSFRNLCYCYNYREIRDVVSLARRGYQLQEKNKMSLDGLDVYIYDAFNRPLSLVDKCRLFLTTTYMRVMHMMRWKSSLATNIMHWLLCKE